MADAFLNRKGGENVTPEVTAQETIIQNITEALVGKVYGANATPETILKGYSAYVHQELVEGTMEAGIDLLTPLGLSTYAIDEITYGSQVNNSTTMNHSLGVIPRFVMLLSDMTRSNSARYTSLVAIFGASEGDETISAGGIKINTSNMLTSEYLYLTQATDKTVGFNFNNTVIEAGVKFTLITLA